MIAKSIISFLVSFVIIFSFLSFGIPAQAANYSGYKLPFTGGTSMIATQTCVDEKSPLGINCLHSGKPNNRYAVDWGCSLGQVVVAVKSGVVYEKSFHSSGYGNFIEIRHNDNKISTYAHMQDPSPLSIGDQVNQGQFVGKCGKSGVDQIHLHLGLRTYGVNDNEKIYWDECNGNPNCYDGQVLLYKSYVSQNTFQFKLNDQVSSNTSNPDLAVRTSACSNESSPARVNINTTGTIISSTPSLVSNCSLGSQFTTWWQIKWSNGITGWSAQNFLKASVQTAPANQVLIYSNTDFTGSICGLNVGTNYEYGPTIPGCPFNLNDMVNAVSIPINTCLEAYQDAYYQGFKVTYCNTQSNNQTLKIPFTGIESINQNTFSSFKVYSVSTNDTSKVFFYVDRDYLGYSSYLTAGSNVADFRHNLNGINRSPLTAGNDNITSFTLPSGKCVEMYQDINYTGISRKYCNDSSTIGGINFDAGQWENDQLSSVKVYDVPVVNSNSTDKKVHFWSNNNKTGTYLNLTGPINISDARYGTFAPMGNDQVSFFELSPKVCMTAYQDINYTGWGYNYCNYSTTQSMFIAYQAGWRENDNISSLKISILP